MTFYLKPPRGEINYHIMENCVQYRLAFYDSLSGNKQLEAHATEYLIEDAALDRTGHYILRLAAFSNINFAYRFLKCERDILLLRLNSFDSNCVRRFLNVSFRHSNEVKVVCDNDKLVNFFTVLGEICKQMLNKPYINHVIKNTHINKEVCKMFTIPIPFQFCTSLVKTREIDLEKGCALLKCTQWKKVFASLYETYLTMVLDEMKYSASVQSACNDTRIKNLLNSFLPQIDTKTSSTRLVDLDNSIKRFPLCMQNLYGILKQNHRLQHNARYSLSVFFKDIGLSMDDSIVFWRNEYSKNHACSKCTHSWKGNEKRYLYSIRHLYGFEGSRKSYHIRSCNYYIDRNLSTSEEGGCPFRHFDDGALKSLLSKHISYNSDLTHKIMVERKTNPQNACKLFYKFCHSDIQSEIKFDDPAQYFNFTSSSGS